MDIAVVSWLRGKAIAPDLKYGGIENMTRNLALAFHRAGHHVTLIAPPGSEVENLGVVQTEDFQEALRWINGSSIDFVYDNTCWHGNSPVRQNINKPFASTSHVMHSVGWSKNVVYLSNSQRSSHGLQLGSKLNNPIIPVPAPDRNPKGLQKESYLLFLGVAAHHKGLHHAVELARRLNRELIVAGPAWGDYVDELRRPWVNFIGEVYGEEKWELLEKAYAVCCLSDGSQGWIEPGAGVVAEANKLGTPVAALNNGCLPELIYADINGWIGDTVEEVVTQIENHLVIQHPISRFADVAWNVDTIAERYLSVFESICNGVSYG